VSQRFEGPRFRVGFAFNDIWGPVRIVQRMMAIIKKKKY
jgi:hypothetical protein